MKHQACRDWFYGRDGHIESVLADFEGEASRVLRDIQASTRPPKRYSADHHTLATFLHIQAQRTAQAVAQANEMLNKMDKSVLRRRLMARGCAGVSKIPVKTKMPAAKIDDRSSDPVTCFHGVVGRQQVVPAALYPASAWRPQTRQEQR